MGYYALNIPNANASTGSVGVCSMTCPHPQYADNKTVTCVLRCSNNTYGFNYSVSGNNLGKYLIK